MPVGKRMFFECAGLLLVSIGLLVGCATRSAGTMGANVVQRIFSAHEEIDQTLLNPAFAYVRVTRAGSPAFLALGAQRLDGGLKRETHYSAQRETLELLDGRVVSLDADGEMFRWNTPSAPKWVSLKLEIDRLPKASASLLSYDRSIDLQAPYRYGHQESITLRALPPSEAKIPGTEKIQQNQRLKSPIKNGVARCVRQPAKSSPPSRNWHSIRLAGNA